MYLLSITKNSPQTFIAPPPRLAWIAGACTRDAHFAVLEMIRFLFLDSALWKWRNTDAEFLCSAQLPDTEPARTTSIDIVLSPFYDDAFRQQRRSMPCDAPPGSVFSDTDFSDLRPIPPSPLLPRMKLQYQTCGLRPLLLCYKLSYLLFFFLAQLSWKLKWAFLIACCLSSVCQSVNFSHFQLLLQNHWANFNQTWHKASEGKGDSSLFKWRATPNSKGR